MMTTFLTAAGVLAAEYGVRRAINAAPETDFPKPLCKGYVLRQAHNYGIVGSRLEKHPKLVLAYQTAATGVAVTIASRSAFTLSTCEISASMAAAFFA